MGENSPKILPFEFEFALNLLGRSGLALALVLVWLMPACNLQATVIVQIGQNFSAATYGVDSQSLPADSDGAIGPKHFVELINGRFSVFDKTNGMRVQTLSDRVFWSNAGVTVSSQLEISDPRVVFDIDSQRWFASSIDANPSLELSNRFLLAISAGVDPTLTWHGVAFPVDPVNGFFGDFPTIGIDASGVYLSADLSDDAMNPQGTALYYIPKGDLLATAPIITGRKSFGILSSDTHGQVAQPAVTRGSPSSGEAILAIGDIGLDFQSHSTLQAFGIQSGVLTDPIPIPIPAYTVPINPTQPDGTGALDDGDARIGSLVYRQDDILYAIHGVQLNDRSALQWFKINATNASVIQTGTIADDTMEFFYGSIAVNGSGTVVICCNGCSVSAFVSSYAFVGETVNGTLTFGAPLLLKAGTTNYHNGDVQGVGTSRWGDYSATSVDPLDQSRFWTIQMIPFKKSAWTTQVTELITSPLILTANASDGNIILSWSSQAAGYQLQSSATLDAGFTWTPVAQTPTTASGQLTVSLPMTGAEAFFRLQKQ